MKRNKLIRNWINLTAMAGWHASHIAWIIDAYSKSHSSLRHQFLTTVPESVMPGRNFKVADVHVQRFPAEFPLYGTSLKISCQMHHSFDESTTKPTYGNDLLLMIQVWKKCEWRWKIHCPILKVVTDIKTKRTIPFSDLYFCIYRMTCRTASPAPSGQIY